MTPLLPSGWIEGMGQDGSATPPRQQAGANGIRWPAGPALARVLSKNRNSEPYCNGNRGVIGIVGRHDGH